MPPTDDESVAHDLASVWHRAHRGASHLPPIERWHAVERIAWLRVAARAREIYALRLPALPLILIIIIGGAVLFLLLPPSREQQIAIDPTDTPDSFTAGN